MIPTPPARDIAIAIADSVTVSIAEEIIGTLSRCFEVKLVAVSTSLGTTCDSSGSRSTSSKVSPSIATFSKSRTATPVQLIATF
ncbi:unannotated protein [freshwater metagenome]|uniref:Unannotated protein n=1 Tax=freshwater metagenome TaxID=449393 RepID=A0A6J7UFN0_9ZZZZ